MESRQLAHSRPNWRALRWWIALALLIATLGGSPGFIPEAQANDLIVTDGADSGAGSLRQVIADAADGDTITFAEGITTVTLTTGELAINSKDLTINGGATGVTIRRSDAQGIPNFRILSLVDADVTLTDLTITNGKLGIYDSGGAGIRLDTSSLTVVRGTVTANTGGSGGGITGGGGFRLGYTTVITLIDSTVSGNTASVSGGGGISVVSGGGTAAILNLTRSTVSGNSARFGGGIVLFAGTWPATLVATDSVISNNTAEMDGGGIYSESFDGQQPIDIRDGSPATLTLTRTTVSGNTANSGSGGGIVNVANGAPATATLIDSTVSGNTAAEFGGGGFLSAYQSQASLSLTSSTVSGNVAGDGGGGLFAGAAGSIGDARVTLDYTTLANNTGDDNLPGGAGHHLYAFAEAGAQQASATIGRSVVAHSDTTLTNYLVAGGGATLVSAGYNVSRQDLPLPAGVGDLANTDPLLGTLADNGGTTRTHLPGKGSEAIDRIPAASCGGVTTDQRGLARPHATGCDSGAVEVGAVPPSPSPSPNPSPSPSPSPQGCASGFADVPGTHLACQAIAALSALGVINGYATNPPTFGPDDGVQRAQVAAFLVRALQWQGEATGPKSFTDFGQLVAELQAASLILANQCDPSGLCAARGYEPTGCAARGLAHPCFGPNDGVTKAQVISFVARAFQFDAAFAWTPQPGGDLPYSGVPTVHQPDVRTYHHYAGAIPNAPTTLDEWNSPASRAWIAMALHQALQTAAP